MWDVVKTDATLKSTLYILDTEDQLSSMKLEDNEDPATHLSKLKQHFQLMLQQHENLMKMGSEISKTCLMLQISSFYVCYRWTIFVIVIVVSFLLSLLSFYNPDFFLLLLSTTDNDYADFYYV